MDYEGERKILEHEIEKLNQEIKDLGYKLSELLNVDCNFGYCSFDPELDNFQDKMEEIERTRDLLEFLKKNLSKYPENKIS